MTANRDHHALLREVTQQLAIGGAAPNGTR